MSNVPTIQDLLIQALGKQQLAMMQDAVTIAELRAKVAALEPTPEKAGKPRMALAKDA